MITPRIFNDQLRGSLMTNSGTFDEYLEDLSLPIYNDQLRGSFDDRLKESSMTVCIFDDYFEDLQ